MRQTVKKIVDFQFQVEDYRYSDRTMDDKLFFLQIRM